MSIDSQIDQFFKPVADALASIVFYSVPVMEGLDVKLLLVWLVAGAVFFTFYLGFINFRYFGYAVQIVRGKAGSKSTDGQITAFQGLMTSMAATVGLGNIAGVALAISVGGPGAAFWLFVMGFFGMSLKFAEVMVGVKYRHHPDPERPDEVYGGPMYYLRDAFANHNLPHLGKFIAVLYSVCCVIGAIGGSAMFQTNQSFQQVINATGGDASFVAGKGWLFGIFMVVISGVVIIGGIKSIAGASSKIVPFMGGVYVLMGLVVIIMDIGNVPHALGVILYNAFTPEAGIGAMLGSLLIGVQRASFSNESGLGSAAISQASIQTDEPVEQGFVGMLGPFIDTVIICSITAFVIVLTGAYEGGNGVEGVELTSRAFGSVVSWFPHLLAVIVFLFAYSTVIGWYYISAKAFAALFGEHAWVENIYKAIYFVAIIVGSASQLDSVILFTDSMLLSMAIPNIFGLYFLAPEIKRDVKEYIAKLKT